MGSEQSTESKNLQLGPNEIRITYNRQDVTGHTYAVVKKINYPSKQKLSEDIDEYFKNPSRFIIKTWNEKPSELRDIIKFEYPPQESGEDIGIKTV